MILGSSYHNNYLKPAPYNLQQIIYMPATMQCNVSIYIKMYKQTSKKGERIKQRDLVLISKRKNKRLLKINKWAKS